MLPLEQQYCTMPFGMYSWPLYHLVKGCCLGYSQPLCCTSTAIRFPHFTAFRRSENTAFCAPYISSRAHHKSAFLLPYTSTWFRLVVLMWTSSNWYQNGIVRCAFLQWWQRFTMLFQSCEICPIAAAILFRCHCSDVYIVKLDRRTKFWS
jgi:hypothetical protein